MKKALLALFLATSAMAQTITNQTVDTGTFGRVGTNTSQAVVAGNPAIIYADTVKSHVVFTRNTAADGSGAWVKTKIASYSSTLIAMDSHVLRVVAGNPAVIFSDNTGVKFARSSTADGSGAWTVYPLGMPGRAAMEVVAGSPAVVSSDAESGESLVFTRCSTSDGSGAWTTTVIHAGSIIPDTISLAIVNGKPAVAYRVQTSYVDLGEGGYYLGELRYATCATADGLGAWAHGAIESNVNSGYQASLAEVDGKPAVSYYDQSALDLRYARNASADGSGAWTITTVDSTNSTGSHPSLLVVDGRPAISYYYTTAADLRFARNANADGSGAWTITTAHGAGSVGTYNSLAIVNGAPAISYYSASSSTLLWARNAAADGSGAWTIITADNAATTGRVGTQSHLAIIAGKPMAVYQDTWWERQKFAVSSTSDGIGTWASQTPPISSYSVAESLAEIAGKPAMVFRDGTTGSVKISINANADASGTWTTTTVNSNYSRQCKLAIIAGYPTVLTRSASNAFSLSNNAATDATGAWTTTSTGSVGYTDSGLVEVSGTPAFAFVENVTYEIKFTRNSAAAGSGTWSSTVIDPTPAIGNYHFNPKLLIIGGKPAVFFVFRDSTGTTTRLAVNSEADGSGTWTTSTLTSITGTEISAGFAGGKPAFTWLDTSDYRVTKLNLTRNTVADGSGVWLTYSIDSGRAGDTGSFVTLGAQTGIAFYDALNRNLEYQLVDFGSSSITVEQPTTQVLANNTASVAFADATMTTAAPAKTFTVRNNGSAPLTVTGITKDGANAADFALSSSAGFTLAPGATQNVSVTFTPSVAGLRTAALHVLSDDASIPSFNVTLTGEGMPFSGIETWRQTWFSTIANTGDAADGADPEGDGITNYYEYAYGLNPTVDDVVPSTQFALNGSNIEFTYTRGSQAVTDIGFAVPWTETLDGLDWNYEDTTELILSDNGTQQVVKATIPMGTNGRRFVRLEVW